MFYEVRTLDLFNGEGQLLIDGFPMSSRVGGAETPEERKSDPDRGILSLARTGPFMPPITRPQNGVPSRVVSQQFREELEKAEQIVGKVIYRPVVKEHISEVQWQHWDRTLDYPPDSPEAEPSDWYISSRPHSPIAAEGLGEIWEAWFPFGGTIRFSMLDPNKKFVVSNWQQSLLMSSWQGAHLFAGKSEANGSWVGLYVDELGKSWIGDRAGDLVEFKQISQVE
jgi:hypothetical protein